MRNITRKSDYIKLCINYIYIHGSYHSQSLYCVTFLFSKPSVTLLNSHFLPVIIYLSILNVVIVPTNEYFAIFYCCHFCCHFLLSFFQCNNFLLFISFRKLYLLIVFIFDTISVIPFIKSYVFKTWHTCIESSPIPMPTRRSYTA
jgi:hypothetical protein